MTNIILFLTFIFCFNAFSSPYEMVLKLRENSKLSQVISTNNLYCKAIVYNDKSEKSIEAELTQASYDKNFLEGTIGVYSFGADKYFLSSLDSLTLVIVNSKANVNAASTAGWRIVNNTKMHDLVYEFKLPDGSKDQAQINCYY